MSTHQFSLAGRKALVTGASRGIGRAIAEGLAGAGADVAIAARNTSDREGCARAISNLGRVSHMIYMDVSVVASCRRGVTSHHKAARLAHYIAKANRCSDYLFKNLVFPSL